MFKNTKNLAVVVLWSLAAVVAISSQTAPAALSGKVERNLRTHIDYLASDKLEGR